VKFLKKEDKSENLKYGGNETPTLGIDRKKMERTTGARPFVLERK